TSALPQSAPRGPEKPAKYGKTAPISTPDPIPQRKPKCGADQPIAEGSEKFVTGTFSPKRSRGSCTKNREIESPESVSPSFGSRITVMRSLGGCRLGTNGPGLSVIA